MVILPIILVLVTVPNVMAQTTSITNLQSRAQQIAIKTGPSFVCNLMDYRAVAVGIGGADLGVSVLDGSELWLMFGDTRGTGPGPPAGGQPTVGSSSAIESQLPFNCSSYSWLTSGGKFYQPLHSTREAGIDESTVPAGAITLNGIRYIYSMQVNDWASEDTHAHGVLFEEKANGIFSELARWPMDGLFVNAAPVAAKLPDGTPVIFLATTAQYRDSPVYLAYVVPSEIGDSAAYHYLTGYDENGSPLWSADMAKAKPLPGFENVWVGELSFQYDAALESYLLMFKDYKTNNFDLYSSSTPYGPFEGPLTFFPCGTTAGRPEWMQSGWGVCYGGYMLPGSFGADGHDLYFDISLWDPYTTVLMTMRLSTPLTTESTSQITSTSSASISAAETTSVPTQTSTSSTETSASSTQTSSTLMGIIEQYQLLILGGVVLLAAVMIAVALRGRREPTPTQSTRTGSTPGMIYCEQCGTQNPTANDFCLNCGTKLH